MTLGRAGVLHPHRGSIDCQRRSEIDSEPPRGLSLTQHSLQGLCAACLPPPASPQLFLPDREPSKGPGEALPQAQPPVSHPTLPTPQPAFARLLAKQQLAPARVWAWELLQAGLHWDTSLGKESFLSAPHCEATPGCCTQCWAPQYRDIPKHGNFRQEFLFKYFINDTFLLLT